jgi:hypothetical protein
VAVKSTHVGLERLITMAKKKLSKEEKLAKKLWSKQVTLPEGKEVGTILAKLFKEGYGIREGRDFYKKYIVNRVKNKQIEREIDDKLFRSPPDAERLPTQKEVFENRRDFNLRRVKKERSEKERKKREERGDVVRKVMTAGLTTLFGRQGEYVDDPTGPDRDISPKEGDFNKGGVVKRKKKPTVTKKTYSRGSRKAKYNG